MKTFIKKQPPGRLIAMGFAMVILIGTCLLLTPWSVRQGVTVKPVDALFSATSAVCVTGLVTIDTADHFTAFGQAIMGLLIQIGGLGVSSVGVGLVIAAGKKVSFKSSVPLSKSPPLVTRTTFECSVNFLKLRFLATSRITGNPIPPTMTSALVTMFKNTSSP